MACSMRVFLCLSLAALCQASYFSVFQDSNSKFYVRDGLSKDGLAFAMYSDDVNSIGWGRLTINTTDSAARAPDATVVMAAAGYLEGFITQERIWQFYQAFVSQFNSTVLPDAVAAWCDKNLAWARAQIAGRPKDDAYWSQVALMVAQLDGMTDGYNDASPKDQILTPSVFSLLSGGDSEDILAAVQANAELGSPESTLLAGFRSMRRPPVDATSSTGDFVPNWGGHCSVIVKPTDDLQELYAAHTTWSSFTGMLRMYKIYNFNVLGSSTAAISTSFSSYPGALSSIDDFYVLSSGLTVMETTNGVFNGSLYKLVTPDSLLSWIRVMVSNRMARGGQQWTEIFALYNSGTYNNQWQVIDYNKFTPGLPIQQDTLWIIEQIPGQCESADISDLLRSQKYFPSYNIPFFKNIYDVSGFPSAVEKWGTWFDYHLHPRALIYAREHPMVQNLNGAKYIQRFNEWQTDPYSVGNSINAISSRGDLVNQTNPVNPFLAKSAFGGIDAKVASRALVQSFQAVAVSGPTYNEQPYFRWTAEWDSVPHYGQPEVFNFDWNLFTN